MAKATVRYNTGTGYQIEVEADDVKSAVKAMSELQEVFGQTECGKCKGQRLTAFHRQDKEGNDYYSLSCAACGAKLDFGQHRTGGTLFAKHKDRDGNYLPDNGWVVWQRRQQDQSPRQAEDGRY
jgi:RNase P subunit RPR2